MHANAFGIPVRRAETPDSAALGAAMLAAIGTGNHGIFQESSQASAGITPAVQPTQVHLWKDLMAEQEVLQRTAL
jgi:sugar (pentulose or hexulose) kinase